MDTLTFQLNNHVKKCRTNNTHLEERYDNIKQLLLTQNDVKEISKKVVVDYFNTEKESIVTEVENRLVGKENTISSDLQNLSKEVVTTNQRLELLEANFKSELSQINETVTETVTKLSNMEGYQNFSDLILPVP